MKVLRGQNDLSWRLKSEHSLSIKVGWRRCIGENFERVLTLSFAVRSMSDLESCRSRLGHLRRFLMTPAQFVSIQE
jgi:hypothetical protein